MVSSVQSLPLTSEFPCVDEGALDALREVLGEHVAEVIGVFLEDTPLQLDRLEHAAVTGCADEVVRIAHMLKSSAASLGALEFSAHCRSIEAAGRADGHLPGPDELSGLRGDYRRAAKALA